MVIFASIGLAAVVIVVSVLIGGLISWFFDDERGTPDKKAEKSTPTPPVPDKSFLRDSNYGHELDLELCVEKIVADAQRPRNTQVLYSFANGTLTMTLKSIYSDAKESETVDLINCKPYRPVVNSRWTTEEQKDAIRRKCSSSETWEVVYQMIDTEMTTGLIYRTRREVEMAVISRIKIAFGALCLDWVKKNPSWDTVAPREGIIF